MRNRVELVIECQSPPDPMEMRAVAAEMEDRLTRDQWASVEALALAILSRECPVVAQMWEVIRGEQTAR